MAIASSASAAPTGRRLIAFTIRYGIPLVLLIGGIVCIILGHGDINHVDGNIPNVDSGSQVFTAAPTGRNSMFSAVGIGAIIVALMVWMVGWMMRMTTADTEDRRREEAARDYFARTGRWPGESPADGAAPARTADSISSEGPAGTST